MKRPETQALNKTQNDQLKRGEEGNGLRTRVQYDLDQDTYNETPKSI